MLAAKVQKLPPEVNRILMIKNLPYNITPDEMYEIFGKFGSIRQIRMLVFSFFPAFFLFFQNLTSFLCSKKTKKNPFLIQRGIEKETKGTAFVVYDDVLCAKKALESLQGFNVAGRYLVVLYYQQKKMLLKAQKEKEIAELKKLNEELAKKIEKR